MIDSQINIMVNEDKYYNKLPFTIEHCIKAMDIAQIDKAIVMINPTIKEIFCEEGHKIKFFDSTIKGEVLIKCLDCKKEIYKGTNPYRKLNEELINQSQRIKNRLFPLVYLPVLPTLSQVESEYYENKYQKKFFGYKFQPSLSNNKISILKNFNSHLPVLVHAGKDMISDPDNILEFAKEYKGTIIVSHFAKFKKSLFNFANTHNNLYINSSPASVMYNAMKKSPEKLFDIKYLKKVKSPSDLFKEILNFLHEDKLLFGSDYPVSSIEHEISILKNAALSKKQFEKISTLNIIKAYSLDKML